MTAESAVLFMGYFLSENCCLGTRVVSHGMHIRLSSTDCY